MTFVPTTVNQNNTTMATTKWSIDPAHSEIQFKVKHMMITTVTGSFGSFSGGAETDSTDSFENARVYFTAETSSINTNAPDRDNHLRSGDFFESEKYPQIKFESTSVRQVDGDEYELEGNLTIKDVTKPVKLKAEFGGIGKDPWGNTKAGFSLSGKINRKEFGLTWNAALETGGVLVSEDVRLIAEVQLLQAAGE
jgi:polyisoprenoid-binding protein YceI